MDLAIITPTTVPGLAMEQPIQALHTRLLWFKMYHECHRARGRDAYFRILYWDAATKADRFFDLAHELAPQEIVPRPGTTQEVLADIDYLQQELHYNAHYMVIPEGRTWDEYLAHTEELLSIKGVATLGIRYEVAQLFGTQTRMSMLERLGSFLRAKNKRVNIHLIDCDPKCLELRLIPRVYPWIRSIETAAPIVWGMALAPFDPEIPVPEDVEAPTMPSGYLRAHLTVPQTKIAKFNITVATNWGNGVGMQTRLVPPQREATPPPSVQGRVRLLTPYKRQTALRDRRTV